jgi:hypothetical protein
MDKDLLHAAQLASLARSAGAGHCTHTSAPQQGMHHATYGNSACQFRVHDADTASLTFHMEDASWQLDLADSWVT